MLTITGTFLKKANPKLGFVPGCIAFTKKPCVRIEIRIAHLVNQSFFVDHNFAQPTRTVCVFKRFLLDVAHEQRLVTLIRKLKVRQSFIIDRNVNAKLGQVFYVCLQLTKSKNSEIQEWGQTILLRLITAVISNTEWKFYAFRNYRKFTFRVSNTWNKMLECALSTLEWKILAGNRVVVDITGRIINPMFLFKFLIMGFKMLSRDSTLSSHSNFL